MQTEAEKALDLGRKGLDPITGSEKLSADVLKAIENKGRKSINYANRHDLIHDEYIVYLNPNDFEALEPKFELLKEAASHRLETICTDNNCREPESFHILFFFSDQTKPGSFRIDSFLHVDEVKTVLYQPGQVPESALCFESEGFDVADSDWPLFFEVFRHLEAGESERGLEYLRRENLDRDGYTLGELLYVLGLFQSGRFQEAFERMNRSESLSRGEHGLYIKALGYLMIADFDRAEAMIEKATTKYINPMGCLIKGLIARERGHKKEAFENMVLAFQEPALKKAKQLYFPLVNRMPDEGAQIPIRVIRLKDLKGTEVHNIVIASQFGMDIAPTGPDKSATRLSVFQPSGAALRFSNHATYLIIKANRALIAGSMVPEEGHQLRPGETVFFKNCLIEYRLEVFLDGWDKPCERDFTKPCHCLWVEGTREFWYLPSDDAFTLGRGKGFGNDMILNDPKVTAMGHVELFWENGEIFFMDLGSTNGTVFNGKPLERRVKTPLTEGDTFGLGDRAFRVHLILC